MGLDFAAGLKNIRGDLRWHKIFIFSTTMIFPSLFAAFQINKLFVSRTTLSTCNSHLIKSWYKEIPLSTTLPPQPLIYNFNKKQLQFPFNKISKDRPCSAFVSNVAVKSLKDCKNL